MKLKIKNIILILFLVSSCKALAQLDTMPPWRIKLPDPARNHSIIIYSSARPNIQGVELTPGDYIGAFYDSLGGHGCAGYVKWTGVNTGFPVWGTDDTIKNGYSMPPARERLKWKIWRRSDNRIFDAIATYSEGPGYFIPNGITYIASLTDSASSPWFFSRTDSIHRIWIPLTAPDIEGEPLQYGDWIGAFYDSLGLPACGGAAMWNGLSQIVLEAYGDTNSPIPKIGFYRNEQFQWRIWRRSDRNEFRARAQYDLYNRALFPEDSLFIPRSAVFPFGSGRSRLLSLNSVGYVDFFSLTPMIIRFGPADLTSSYRMIGLPGDSAFIIPNFINGTPIKDWVAFYDDGEDNYLPYTGSTAEEFYFTPGRSYWILSKYPFVIKSVRVRAVIPDNDFAHSIQVRRGWNMISNPFHKIVPWEFVRAMNGLSEKDKIFEYVNGKYDGSSRYFEPYRGYYYYNNSNSSVLRIPYPSLFIYGPLGSGEKENEIKISLTINDETKAEAFISINKNSKTGEDEYDAPAPPDNLLRHNIYLEMSGFTGERNKFYSESKPIIENGESFLAAVKTVKGESAALKFDGLEAYKEKYEIILIREYDGSPYDLKNCSRVEFQAVNEKEKFKIFIGDKKYIENIKAEIPDDYKLFQNFPNPFNGTTRINYSLKYLSHVEMTIYDALGRTVVKFNEGNKNPGSHEIIFNACNLSSGVYFYSLKAFSVDGENGFSETKKMIYLK